MPNTPSRRNGPGAGGATTVLGHAINAQMAGWHDEAERLYQQVLKIVPHQFDALHMLGVINAQRNRFDEADKLLRKALKVNPKSAEAHSNHGRVLAALGRREEALAAFDKALANNPGLVVAIGNRGALLREFGRPAEALAGYDRALTLAPGLPDLVFNRGNALMDLGRIEEALAAFDDVLRQEPGYWEARIARANLLGELRRDQEALAELDEVIAGNAKNAVAVTNRGVVLARMGREDDALAAYNAAIVINPGYAKAYFSRGFLMMKRGHYRNATADFAATLHLDGQSKYALGYFIMCRLHTCEWAGIDEAWTALRDDVGAGRLVAEPEILFACPTSAAEQLACARMYTAGMGLAARPVAAPRAAAHDRIRIAYLAPNFLSDPIVQQAAGLFAHHDRGRFHVTAVSFGPDLSQPVCDALADAFDDVVAIHGKSDHDVAVLLREREIDIAVDLMGHTVHGRPGILAERAAPIQVSYLGYAGTTGADYADYIVADPFAVPDGADRYFTEHVVRLPHAFMAVGSSPASTRSWTRADAGLPQEGVVFCAFGAAYKIVPAIFLIWMNLLKEVDGSVLWLKVANEAARAALQREAQSLGVAPERLVFADRLEAQDDHFARLRLADLVLDTPTRNGKAGTADALRAGVPVVTCAGATFASRIGGSLLSAAGLPELVTVTLPDYQALALALARDPTRLAAIRAKLVANRDTQPLFDTARFARDLEAAYVQMYERAQRGEAPQAITVP
jgi:protein O-GlcNAc transferase